MNQSPSDAGIGRRITRYSTLLTLSGILCKLLLLVYTLLAVRILGEVRFGRIEYFIEVAIIFTVLLDFGLEQTVTRELARRRESLPSLLVPLLGYRFIATVISAFVMVGFLWLTQQEGHTLALMICATLYFFITSLVMLVRAIVRSFEWLNWESAANLLDKVIHIGIGITLLAVYPKLPALALAYSAGAMISLLIYSGLIWRATHIENWSLSWRVGVSWQQLAWPIGLSAACILLLHRQDTVMVNWIQGDAETGLYRAPYRLLEGLFLFPQVMAISAYPVFSRLFHQGKPFAQTAGLLMRGLLMLSLPIAIGGIFTGHGMLLTLMDNLPTKSGDVFVILLWSLPFIYLNFILGTILNATDRHHLNLRASAWGMVSNVLINIPAILYLGAIGAALVTVFSQGLYAARMLIYTRDLNLWHSGKRYAAIALACLVMAAVLYQLAERWYIEIPIGAVVYLLTLLLCRGLSRHEISNIMRVVRNR